MAKNTYHRQPARCEYCDRSVPKGTWVTQVTARGGLFVYVQSKKDSMTKDNTTIRTRFWDKRFLGSNVALILGLLEFAGSLSSVNGSGMDAGIFMIIGSLAYRSAKQRKLKLSQDSWLRKCFEVAALVLLSLMILMRTNVGPLDLIYNYPFTYLLIPLWAIIAYLIAVTRKESLLERN